jgi:hypothetical protein
VLELVEDETSFDDETGAEDGTVDETTLLLIWTDELATAAEGVARREEAAFATELTPDDTEGTPLLAMFEGMIELETATDETPKMALDNTEDIAEGVATTDTAELIPDDAPEARLLATLATFDGRIELLRAELIPEDAPCRTLLPMLATFDGTTDANELKTWLDAAELGSTDERLADGVGMTEITELRTDDAELTTFDGSKLDVAFATADAIDESAPPLESVGATDETTLELAAELRADETADGVGMLELRLAVDEGSVMFDVTDASPESEDRA